MSKLIDGKYTVQIPFSTGTQYISSDNVIESDSQQTLSNVINSLQAVVSDDTTNSTNQTTGSLIVKGGIGQANGMDFYAGNDIYIPNNRFLVLKTSGNTASLYYSAGIGLMIQHAGVDTHRLGASGNIITYGSTIDQNYGSAVGNGLFRFGSSLRTGFGYSITSDYSSMYGGTSVENLRVTGTDVKVLATSQATSQTTGSLQISGGIGQASGKDFYAGNDIFLPNNRFLVMQTSGNTASFYYKNGVGATLQHGGSDKIQFGSGGTILTYGTTIDQNYGSATGISSFRFGSTLRTGFTYNNATDTCSLYGGSSVEKISVSNTVNTFISTNNNLFNNTTDASSSADTSASVYTAGGISCAKKIYTGTGIYLPTSGGTASPLNFYEEWSASTTFQSSAGGGTTAVRTVVITRNGKLCTIKIPEFQINANAGQIQSNTAIVPTRFRPANGLTLFPIFVQDANTIQSSCGVLSLYTGVISILKSPVGSGNFSAGTGSGCVAGSDIIVSYCVN